jgi:hypothetical protein
MKTILFSALLVATSLPLAAQEIVPYEDYFVSSRSRAEVMNETARAAAAGELTTQGEIVTYVQRSSSTPSLSRAEVRAELARAEAAGELSAQNEITAEPVFRMRESRSQLASGGSTHR